jgi:phenylacetate-CoA ligase
LEQSQWWPRERIAALQAEKMRGFLGKIYDDVPYYRQQFDDLGIECESIRTLEDLGRLPFLTKALIRSHTEELKARNAGRLTRFNTGGSTGEPLIFFMGKDRVAHDVAAKWRATRWWDVDIGDPEIVVWGSPIELGAQDRLRELRDRLLRTRLLPAFEMSESNVVRFLDTIERSAPRMLFGYPSSLSLLARAADREGRRMDRLGIAVAFVTAERLYEDQRADIARVFGCSVANGYGGRDAGFIAHECPSGGMHIMAEDIIVEIVDDDGLPLPPGQAGEIVVTHMATGDFPFVRYRTGDIGVLDDGDCLCGRGLPLLREIQGRSTDFVVARDGTIMHGLSLIYVLRDIPTVRKFKIVQHSRDRTEVLLVPNGGFEASIEEKIKTELRKRLGEAVRIDISKVDSITAEQSGKFRYVVSHVDPKEAMS